MASTATQSATEQAPSGTAGVPVAGCTRRLRILVTGGAGFIGSHLVDRLMKEGHQVICMDNFFSGNKSNVQHWIGHPRFELIRHDVTQKILLEVDQVYHLACPASPVHYQLDAVKTLRTCFEGTLNMLELAKASRARLLLTSTSEVYGDPDVHPQVEEYWGNVNPIGLRSCYDEGKRIGETLCMEFHRQHGLPVRIARIFNTYGPRMQFNDGRVVSNFIVQALSGKPISVYGTGEQTRSFCFVDDLVDGLIRLMNGPHVGPINIGNPGEYTINELARRIQEMVNPALEVEFRPIPSDDPRRRKPDITKATELLGWRPTVDLATGLRATIDDFAERRNSDSSGVEFAPAHQKTAQ